MTAATHSCRKPLVILLLMTMTLLGVFPVDVVLPSFPALSDHFQIPTPKVALSVSVFVISLSLSILVVGPLSDRWGRKRLLLAGIAFAVIGAVGCTFASDYSWFLAFRVLQAVGCGAFSLSQALVQDLFCGRERQRLRIWMVTAGGVFISISPLLGTWLQSHLGWQGSFNIFVVLAITIWCSACWLLEENPATSPSSHRHFLSIYREICSDARFMGYWAISALAFACHFSFIVSSPTIFMERLALSPYEYAWTLLMYGAAYVMGGMLANVLHRYLHANTQILLGLGLIAVSGAVMLSLIHQFGMSTATVLTAMLICTLGTTIVRPIVNCKAMDVYPANAGASTSIGAMLIFLFGGLISWVINQVPAQLTTTLACGFLLSSTLGLGLHALICQKTRQTR